MCDKYNNIGLYSMNVVNNIPVFVHVEGVIIVLLCLGVLTGYLYGYHKTTTSSDSSPCPAAG